MKKRDIEEDECLRNLWASQITAIQQPIRGKKREKNEVFEEMLFPNRSWPVNVVSYYGHG
jgi:hypothetical protein